jgi:hypothetical protein
MPGLAWPLQTTRVEEDDFFSQLYAAVAQPILGKHHDYFNHHHLMFDQSAGQEEFRKTVHRIFAHNGVTFEMLPTGRIMRVLPLVLGEDLNYLRAKTQLGRSRVEYFSGLARYGKWVVNTKLCFLLRR